MNQDRYSSIPHFLDEILGGKGHRSVRGPLGLRFRQGFGLFTLFYQLGPFEGRRFFCQESVEFSLVYVKFKQIRGVFEGHRVAKIQAGTGAIAADGRVNDYLAEGGIHPQGAFRADIGRETGCLEGATVIIHQYRHTIILRLDF